jgi:hypothetical protein
MRWYVLPRMICDPVAATCSGSRPLTVPWVPTGMNAGVSNEPWRVVTRPRRARVARSVASNSYRNAGDVRGGRSMKV